MKLNVKTKIPKTKVPKVRPTKSKPLGKFKGRFSSRKGFSVSSKNMTTKQAKALLKLQKKYELNRAKAGIMSPEAMAHHERMAKIKGDTATKIASVSQLTGSATALGTTSMITKNDKGNASIQVNGGMTDATQGRPIKPTTPSKPDSKPNKNDDE